MLRLSQGLWQTRYGTVTLQAWQVHTGGLFKVSPNYRERANFSVVIFWILQNLGF
jgi:hypothetical protein